MNRIRITQTLQSDTLHLPQLRPWVGRQVEIIVLQTETDGVQPASPRLAEGWVSPLADSVRAYESPFEPATAAEEWEANQ